LFSAQFRHDIDYALGQVGFRQMHYFKIFRRESLKKAFINLFNPTALSQLPTF